MAIIACDLHWNGATGLHERAKGSQYTAIWRAQTDNANDQAQTVINWFRANRVELGDFYSYANDTTSTVSRAKRIRADRDLKSVDIWIVVVDYETDEDTEQEDENGNPTSNPLDFRPDISEEHVQYTRPVHDAEYISGFVDGAQLLWGKDSTNDKPAYVGPRINSAGVPYNPPGEREDSRIVIRIKRNRATVDANEQDELMNAVNDSSFIIDKFGYSRVVPPLWSRIRGVNLAIRRQNAVTFWEQEVYCDLNPDTWRHFEPDRGVQARAMAGDPDGNGGTLSGADIITGVPQFRQLTDIHGTPISDPVLLDGNGQPLAPGGAPVIIEWRDYVEIDYRTFAFFNGLIT